MRQNERDPQLDRSSPINPIAQGQLSCDPRAARSPDVGPSLSVLGGMESLAARRRGSLSVQRVNECLVLLMMYFKNNHNFNFLVFITFFCLAFI